MRDILLNEKKIQKRNFYEQGLLFSLSGITVPYHLTFTIIEWHITKAFVHVSSNPLAPFDA